MLKAERREILPRVNLTCVHTDKFKTSFITLNLINGISRESIASYQLISRVLRRGTAKLPDMEAIAGALDELYGADINPNTRKIGELLGSGLTASFLSDDLVPKGENLLEHVAALLGEMLLNPRTENGLLYAEYVESEKRNAIDEIRATINEKRSYAIRQLTRKMCADEKFGIFSEEEDIQAITTESLTAQYKKWLAESRVEILYAGTAEFDTVAAALGAALAELPRAQVGAEPTTDIRLVPVTEEPRFFTESLDVLQGQLVFGFRLGETMKNPDYAALSVFNTVYGGGVTSKLFLNVREKLSLAYYASSGVIDYKGIMIAFAGVEFTKRELAESEILAQLEAMRRGEIEEWEFQFAKRAVVSGMVANLDSPGGIEGTYFDMIMKGLDCAPEELAQRAEAVTLQQVVDIANSVKLDSVYFLQGTEVGNEQ
ncbi:MAG: insulinase family protein [Oscillospiraceae bacterium]|nr:insulinase family protein [Oscillospiraceae bacterium]